MKIIITGAGAVGYHLAKMLSSESQDIYVVDENQERLNYVQSHLDIYAIHGDAKLPSVLQEAQVESCDLLIAVTSSEETNLLIGVLGKKFGARRVIARINSPEFAHESEAKLFQGMGIDEIISPMELAACEIKLLVEHSLFTDECEFEDGKLRVVGIVTTHESPIINKTVKESAHLNPDLKFRPIALNRNQETIIVKADTIIREGDTVYFISDDTSLPLITELSGQKTFNIENVMILGGSSIGILVAEKLQDEYNVTLVERNRALCEEIAGKLKNTLVLNADGRDVNALEEEGLADMDAFIAVTGDSESNIISSLVAKNHNVKKTIARVENIDYIHLSQRIGIDALINKKIIAAGNIFKFVRKGHVDAIAALHGVDAEIIEFTVKPGSQISKNTIANSKIPSGCTIAGVVRGNEGYIPFGDFQILAGDKVVVFSLNECIQSVEKVFL